jgi:hypothetical protein
MSNPLPFLRRTGKSAPAADGRNLAGLAALFKSQMIICGHKPFIALEPE